MRTSEGKEVRTSEGKEVRTGEVVKKGKRGEDR